MNALSQRYQASLVCAAAALTAASCGYSLVGHGSNIPSHVRTVYVERVDVGDGDIRTGDDVARNLREELRRNGRFRPVKSRAGADAVLSVTLVQDRVTSTGFDEFDEALSYDTFFIANARLEDADGHTLWSREKIGLMRNHAAVAETVVTSSSSFQANERLDPSDLAEFDGVQVGENRRAVARTRLTQGLAREIYVSMTEDF